MENDHLARRSLDAKQDDLASAHPMRTPKQEGGVIHALKGLFTREVGLMRVTGIAFVHDMGVFVVRHFARHMQDDADKAAAALQR